MLYDQDEQPDHILQDFKKNRLNFSEASQMY